MKTTEILKWQGILLLVFAIVFFGNYVYKNVFEQLPPVIGTNTSGKITAVTKIITAEQKQTYARFVETQIKNPIWQAVTFGKVKGMLYFQWEAKNSYGIDISDENPIKWARTENEGEIEITAPSLKLLDSKILIDSDKYVVLDIDREVAISESRIKEEMRDKQVEETKSDALKVLDDDTLNQISKSVIASHVMQILNQGLTTDKISSAIVTFR
ncbi:hypothetical protein ACEVAQ_07955 [Ectopseudomonas khazarica]|uniref:DUF4230 domain-containing protein n=1 Tax=Ectopseudomonas khazarica TaxID=2502979 RepID=A0ABW7MAN0_9GAMM